MKNHLSVSKTQDIENILHKKKDFVENFLSYCKLDNIISLHESDAFVRNLISKYGIENTERIIEKIDTEMEIDVKILSERIAFFVQSFVPLKTASPKNYLKAIFEFMRREGVKGDSLLSVINPMDYETDFPPLPKTIIQNALHYQSNKKMVKYYCQKSFENIKSIQDFKRKKYLANIQKKDNQKMREMVRNLFDQKYEPKQIADKLNVSVYFVISTIKSVVHLSKICAVHKCDVSELKWAYFERGQKK